jgi:hypothetical protein
VLAGAVKVVDRFDQVGAATVVMRQLAEMIAQVLGAASTTTCLRMTPNCGRVFFASAKDPGLSLRVSQSIVA